MSFGTFGTFGGFGNKQNNSTPAFGSTFGNNNQQNNGVNFANQPIAQTPAVNPLTIILQGYKNMYCLEFKFVICRFVDKTNQDDSVFSCVMFNYCPANLREEYTNIVFDDRLVFLKMRRIVNYMLVISKKTQILRYLFKF